LKAGERLQRLADGGGLYIEVAPTGAKTFRLRCYQGKNRKCLTLGPYPKVTLAVGEMRVDELTAQDVLCLVRPIAASGAVESAHEVRSRCSQAFRPALGRVGKAEPSATHFDQSGHNQGGHRGLGSVRENSA
jgi:hypothetical protein